MHPIKKYTAVAQALVALGIALWPFLLQPVCGPMKNGHFMACHDAAWVVTVGGGLLFALAILPLIPVLATWRPLTALVAVLQLIVTAGLYAIPHRLIPLSFRTSMEGTPIIAGLCHNPDMPCHGSFGHLTWLLILMAILALIPLFRASLGGQDA